MSEELALAQRKLREGHTLEASAAFARVLEREPGNVEALKGAAVLALHAQNPSRAVTLLERAAELKLDDFSIHGNLALALEAAGNLHGALTAFSRAAALNPDVDVLWLHQAQVQERLGLSREAALAYLRALRLAQGKGRWLGPGSTPSELQPRVEHAIGFTLQYQQRLYGDLLEPLSAQFGKKSLDRVQHCLRIYLGMERAQAPDPRQQPTFLFFPGLPATAYLPHERFAWIPDYEAATDAIRAEARTVLARREGLEAVFADERLARQNLRSDKGDAGWEGVYFYRYGRRNSVNCEAHPRTQAAIERLPLSRVPGNAPEVMFSVLAPGTHLLPHRGVTNTRLVTHLPLIVPRDCALRVGGELHEWREGRAVVFDDTYEHEAWNRSNEPRIVLIADIWHPDLDEAERAAMALLGESISEFRLAADRLGARAS